MGLASIMEGGTVDYVLENYLTVLQWDLMIFRYNFQIQFDDPATWCNVISVSYKTQSVKDAVFISLETCLSI